MGGGDKLILRNIKNSQRNTKTDRTNRLIRRKHKET